MDPKVSINDRFYKVFPSTFPDTPKRCLTNGFLMFHIVENCINFEWKPNAFLYFWIHFAEMDPKVFIIDRFYKAF